MEQTYTKEILQRYYLKRVEKNPHFSIRSLAKFLGVSHSLLSMILSGKRTISKEMVRTILARLQLTEKQKQLILAENNLVTAKTALAIEYNKLSLDQFATISEWQHYAILSLLEIPDFKMDFQWIAKRLNISPLLAKTSATRLVRLRMIEKDKEGRWKQTQRPIVVENKISTTATKGFQSQLLKKAHESLQNDPIEIRDHSSITFAMNPRNMPMAIEKIREFRRKLCKELEDIGNPEEVYNLCVQLYPVSRRSK